MIASAVLLAVFDCPCGEQVEVRVEIDVPSVRCAGRCTPETGCDAESAQWHAVQPVTCEGCGKRYAVEDLDVSDALAAAVRDAERNERER